MAKLKLDDAELHSRRAFFELTDEDLRRLQSLRPFAERHMDSIIEGLYRLLLGHGPSRKVFVDDAAIHRAQRAQRQYFLGLFAGKCDLAYVEDRLRIGITHERVGVDPKWYIGAYAFYQRLIAEKLAGEITDRGELQATLHSIAKIIGFDTALAIDAYIGAQMETIARHQAAIRELSTPIIRIRPGILLLPLVGTVDTLRAEQVMETALLKVTEEQAQVLIIDIAGVPLVDSKVADHLIKTTEAVQLLGAKTILTGISPTVAKTVVRLGLDISAMHTQSRLADGLQLASRLLEEASPHQVRRVRRRRA